MIRKHIMQTFTVTPDDASKRIDLFLAEQIPTYTRGQIQASLKAGKVLRDSKPSKASYKVDVGDVITIEEIIEEIDTLVPNTEIVLDIVDETADFLVINKPRGIQAHPSSVEKLATIANALIAHDPSIATVGDDPMRPGIMSRLDKYTSGLMVIAKNQKTFDALKSAFGNREVHKTYHALIWGEPKILEDTIDAPIARAVGYTRQKVAFGKYGGDAKEAVTEYKTLATHSAKDLLDLTHTDHEPIISHMELYPKTGRMHQLRVHMAHMGRSIIGDIKYERKNEKLLNKKLFNALPENDFHTFYLHAKKLSFTLDGQERTYELTLPEHFEYVLQLLGK